MRLFEGGMKKQAEIFEVSDFSAETAFSDEYIRYQVFTYFLVLFSYPIIKVLHNSIMWWAFYAAVIGMTNRLKNMSHYLVCPSY